MIEIRDALASARMLLESGRYDDAVARTVELVEHARDLGDDRALAWAIAEHGMALVRAGDWQRAIEVSREAHELATSAGVDEVAANAAYRIAFAHTELRRPSDALEWIRHARAACDRIEDPERRADTELVVDGVHTTVLLALGRTDEARTIAARALQQTEARIGPGDTDLVVALEDIAAVCMEEGDLACAEPHLVRALALAESAWGEEHPRTTIVVTNLGHLEELREDYPAASRWFARALRDSEAVLGPHHPDVAKAHYNVGVAGDRLRDYETARREFGVALALFRETLGEDHPVVAMTLHNLGAVALAEQDFGEAERLYARAQGIVERTLGASDPELTRSLLGRAEAAIGRTDGAAALAFIARAEVIEREQGTVPDVESLFRLARAQRANGDESAAHRTAEAALALANAGEAETLREFIAESRASTLASGH
jgi:tetratricopeptide (TPR) repeat protein